MGYLLKAGLGLALFFGGIVLFNVKLVEALEIGTCASGNTPYQIARPCPEGAGTVVLLMMGSIVAGLIGAALFAFRGRPPWGNGRRAGVGGAFGLGILAWGIFFAGTGANVLIASRTNETIGADGELGGTIVGITFLVMGVPPLLLGLWSSAKRLLGGRDERPSGQGAGTGASVPGLLGGAGHSGGNAIAKIERLQRLRESGALTEAEFERQKTRILSEG